MSDPAALIALPGLIRAARAVVEENAPTDVSASALRYGLMTMLFGAEVLAEHMAEVIRLSSVAAPVMAQQQMHAPLGERVEPCVPRRPGRDPRLPLGRHHP